MKYGALLYSLSFRKEESISLDCFEKKLNYVFLVKFSSVEKWESRSNKAKLFSRKYPRHKEEKTCALKITGSPIKNWVR